MSDQARVEFDGNSFDSPVIVGSEREQALDISSLRSETGLVTYDPGYANTGSAKSGITFLDGEAGVLRYRGYPIEQLAEHSSFLETAYLLINGELPSAGQLETFETSITMHTLVHEDMRRFFDAFPKNAHPMAILAAATAGLSTFYQDHYDPLVARDVEVSSFRLIAKLPTVAAWAYKKSIGQAYIYPSNKHGYSENFLRMMFGVKAEPYEVDSVVAKALDQLLILHADHEQNCSTSTVRMVGSSHVNMFAAISAGITALWGPRHGGANQEVVEMLENIRDADGDASEFINRAKDKNDPFRLMGFGHRVYKNFDPRATIIKQTAHDVIEKLVGDDPLFEVARELEEAALSHHARIERMAQDNLGMTEPHEYVVVGQ